MRRLLAILILIPFTASSVFGALPVPQFFNAYPKVQRELITRSAPMLGVRFDPEGFAVHVKDDGQGGTVEQRLQEAAVQRVLLFLSKLPADDPELGMALAMRSYLGPRMTEEEMEKSEFMKRDEQGSLRLTQLGKQALFDILTATDGRLLEPEAKKKKTESFITVGLGAPGTPPMKAGTQSVTRSRALMKDPSAAFDGSKIRLGGFDWSGLDGAVSAPGRLAGTGKVSAQTKKKLEGYAYDEEKGTVRVMIAADKSVQQDRFKVADGRKVEAEVYGDTGLDADLLRKYKAKVVRAVDNIVTVDVSLKDAAAMGLALKDEGIESRPARLFKAASKAAADALQGATGRLLGLQFAPLPSNFMPALETPSRGRSKTRAYGSLARMKAPPGMPYKDLAPRKTIRPQLVESRPMIKAEALRKAGMQGKGTVVGIIDSGVDMKHPDLMDGKGNSRVESYLDFTDEGKDDVVGHGTHVAGILGGNGAASDGKRKGMAPETRFRVAKVFGQKGETDESVILAAMKWMAGDKEKGRESVDVLNMSLGGPGTPNQDPLSAMANRLTVKENVLVVAAAGNSGPFENSVGSPGNARYALTVGGVDKDGKAAFFSSRGPVRDEYGRLLYAKPDLVGVSGNVDFSKLPDEELQEYIMVSPRVGGGGKPGQGTKDPEDPKYHTPKLPGLQSLSSPVGGTCIYEPGVIAPRSSSDPDTACTLQGNPAYRYMSGTSQATPMAAGFAADVIGYLKENGAEVDAFQVKALLVETARDLKMARETQGAGLLDGKRLLAAVTDRVKRGIPVGNVAYSLARRLTTQDVKRLDGQKRYRMTPLGLLDTESGRLVNNEPEMDAIIRELRQPPKEIYVQRAAPIAA